MPFVAYWGLDKDVLWADGDHPEQLIDTLHGAMQNYVTRGYVCEILEYYPEYTETTPPLADRCDYWREVLREQGYEIRRIKL